MKTLIAAFLLTTACIVSSTSRANEVPLPNFVVIFIDDLGYADVGCFGGTIATPRIDRLAKEGMRFTSFYAQPICGPSRAAIMTGCYPMRVAERNNKKNTHPELHDKEITVAEVLKPRGYATGCFGKWDLAGHRQVGFVSDLFPTHQGYDYFFGTPSSNDQLVHLFRNDQRIEERAPMTTLTERYTDEAVQFIHDNKQQPFFIYMPHTMVHTKLAVSKQFAGKSPRGLYGDVVRELDHNIGRVIDALNEAGVADNTYVLFTSDNGPWLIKNKNHRDGIGPEDHGGTAGPLRSGKVSTWEGGMRVPTIWWAPGKIKANTTCDGIASTLDVLPTVAALAGADVPNDRIIDGEDIRYLLDGRATEATADKAFLGYLCTQLETVRQGKWKLHLARPEKRPWLPFGENRHIAPDDRIAPEAPLLFDLDDDLGEQNDVADDHPEVVARLLEVAELARQDIGDYNRIGKGQRFFDDGPKRPGAKRWIDAASE